MRRLLEHVGPGLLCASFALSGCNCGAEPTQTGPCSVDVDCPAGAWCREGACVRCPACAAGETCVGGTCLPAQCGDVFCLAGEGCRDGRCISARCLRRACAADEGCARGECFPLTCGLDTACGAGAVCDSGRCVANACAGIVCEPGETCAGGRCLPLDCPERSCADGAVCAQGECTPIPCVEVRCPESTACVAGRCLSQSCTALASTPSPAPACRQGLVCTSDALGQALCVDPGCAGLVCPSGERCEKGACLRCEPSESLCVDGRDGDCDGKPGCRDPDCAAKPACACRNAATETACSDGVDDDCDGKVDCLDSDCLGRACDDLNACTISDVCRAQSADGSLVCLGSAITCSSPPSSGCSATNGTCQPSVGCVYPPVAKGTACSDGNPCTAPDSCDGEGRCVGGTAMPDGALWKSACPGCRCCEGRARDLSTDPNHCGGCGSACASQVCQSVEQPDTCPGRAASTSGRCTCASGGAGCPRGQQCHPDGPGAGLCGPAEVQQCAASQRAVEVEPCPGYCLY